MDVPEEIARACDSGLDVRLHTRDGEVLVAQVLEYDAEHVRYAVVTSSRPERYAVCDSTGFWLAMGQIERAQLLDRSRDR